VISSLFHLAIIIAIVVLTRAGVMLVTGDQGVGTGTGTGAAGGGGGGGREDVISILVSKPEPPPTEAQLVVPTEVEPVPEVEEKPPEPEVELAIIDSVPKPATPANPPGGTGTGEGTGTGAGTGQGVGPGSGGGTGGGSGGGVGSGVGPGTGSGKILGPSPEVLLVPPTPPGNVRGKRVVVRLAVDSAGVVNDAEIIPSTGNRKYDETLKRTALGWRFRAARDPSNRPVGVLFDVTFTF
jgi:TonB family protein